MFKIGNFIKFLNESKLTSAKFKEALKIKDYGFMIGTIADIVKTHILDEMKKANIDSKYLEYRLPGNHAEIGDKTLYYINYKTEKYTKGITTKINPESISSIIELVNEFVKDIVKNSPKKSN